MLDRVSPKQFDEWVAFDQLEPPPIDRLIAIVRTGLVALCQAWGVKLTPEDLDPWLKEEAAQEVKPTQAYNMLKIAYGG